MAVAPIPSLDIPALEQLSKLDRWVCWRFEERDGKQTKVPVQPNGIRAATTSPSTWSTFASCVAALGRNDLEGVGFVFSGGIFGIDLDKCRDPKTGAIEPWATEIVSRFASYAEVTPSGTGLHILAQGHLPRDGARRGRVEVYQSGRYFTVTGKHLETSPDTIEQADDEAIEWLWATHINKRIGAAAPLEIEPGQLPWDKMDALLENDDRFRKTWLHKRADLQDQSLSTYDFSLCIKAAQAGWEDAELGALIQHHRQKWGGGEKAQRKDYIPRTVQNVREVLRSHIEGRESVEAAVGRVVARERAEAILDGGQDAALRELRVRLDLPIKRVLITGEKTAIEYSLFLDDGRRIPIGSPGYVLNQATIRTAAFGAVGKVVPQVKQPVWDATVMVLHAAAEREDAADSDPVQELLGIVDEYLFRDSANVAWDDEHAPDFFKDGAPLFLNGHPLVTIKHFYRWCSAKGMTHLKIDDVRDRLRVAGWAGKKVSKRVDGKTATQFYWSDRNPVTGPSPSENGPRDTEQIQEDEG